MTTMPSQEGSLSFEQVVIARVVIRRMQARRSARYGRWNEAFRILDQKDKATLGSCKKVRLNAQSFTRCIEKKRLECESKKWTAFTRSDGKEVKVRDVLDSIASWVKRFEPLGDTLAGFAPLYAGLPWAGVKFLIELSVSDFETYSTMVEGLEIVSHVIVQIAEVEKSLSGQGGFKRELSRTIIELYVKVLGFLAAARRFFDQNTGVRIFKGLFQRLKSTVTDFIGGISSLIVDVYRLSNEVRWEETTTKSESRHNELLSALKNLMESITNPKKSIDDHRVQVQGWLSPNFTKDACKEALGLRHGSTCEWVLQLPEFSTWTMHDGHKSQVLWLHGPAGFGKTVMCARIIDHMERNMTSYGWVLFFFCSGEDTHRRHPFAILKSWIGQLLAKDDTAVEVAVGDLELQQRLKEGISVSEGDQVYLWSLLRKMIKKVSSCTLVIDGYDECDDTSMTTSKYHTQACRPHFLQELIKTIDGTGTRVLLVSRNQPDIEKALKDGYERPGLNIIEYPITKDNTTADLSSFSEAIFTRKLSKRAATGGDIAGEAVKKSEGMFLWISLLDRELQEGATKNEVKRLLSDMPSKIDGAYQRELQRIMNPDGDKDLAKRAVVILKWVLYAARPLAVCEMAEALAVAFNDSPSEYPYDDLPDPFTKKNVDAKYVDNYIRMPCGSLIELRKESAETPLAMHTIHFVHFSVKEFLLRNPLCISQSDPLLSFGEQPVEHSWMAGLCLQYMCYDEFDDASERGVENPDAFLDTYPFFSYTTVSWSDHFDRGKPSINWSDASNTVWKMFSTRHWRLWAELFEAEMQNSSRDMHGLNKPVLLRSHDSGYVSLGLSLSDDSESEMTESEDGVDEPDDEPDDEPENELDDELDDDKSFETANPTVRHEISPSPVYYAAILGLTDIVERLIKNGHDSSLEGGILGNALQAAVVNGQGPTIEVLMKYNANASQEGGKYGTPLIAAIIRGSDDIFVQLISSCKELDASDQDGNSALHYACGLGALDMVVKLIDAGASLNLKSKSGRTPLIRAISQEHPEVVEYLLKKGADANERTRSGQTPLLLAVEMGNEDIIQQLLDHGADLHMQSEGVTALHVACYVGSESITQLLLDHGAVVDAEDDSGWTPLHWTAHFNSQESAKLLLKFGASPLASGYGVEPPFGYALRRRATSMLEIFNSHESTNGSGSASLLLRLALALEESYAVLVESLLKDFDQLPVQAEVLRDILALALKTGSQTIFQQIVEKFLKHDKPDRSSVNTQDESVWSDEEQRFLEQQSWGTDVQKAMVLDQAWRVFPGARHIVPDAMLPLAVANRSHDVVRLLLTRGADPYRRIGSGNGRSLESPPSALQTAVNQDSRELVALILAESQRPATESRPGLLAALEETGTSGNGMRRADLAKMLIAHGALDADADPTTKTGESKGLDDQEHDSGVEDEVQTISGDTRNTAVALRHDDRNLSWWTKSLVGKWTGSYSYKCSRQQPDDPTWFKIDSVSSQSLSSQKKDLYLFSGGGDDTVAEFEVHGQIMSGSTIRFIKLYPTFGWMYEGDVEEAEGGEWRMKGRWADQFGAKPEGHFMVMKEMSD